MAADGLSLYARDYPAAAGLAKVPVIAIHGLTRNAADFDHIPPLIAQSGRRVPALDVRGTGGRVREAGVDPEHRAAANTWIRLEAAFHAHEDLISVGAYKPGANRAVDTALAIRPEMLALLQQRPDEQQFVVHSSAIANCQ